MRRSTALTLLATALAVLVFCPEVNASEDTLWRYLYPGTKTIVGVDLVRAKNSAAGKMLARQFQQLQQSGAFKVTGNDADILAVIDRILISTNGSPAGASDKPPVVIAVQGRLSRELVQKMAPKGTAVQKFKGTDLFIPFDAKADDPLLALINEQYALIGDKNSIALVLDSQGASSADAETLGRAVQLASECEVFIVSREPLDEVAGGGAEAMPGLNQLEEIQAIDFGLSLSQGLGLKGVLTAKDAASAQGMAMMVQMMSTMMLNDPNSANSEMAKIARSVKVRSEGPAVTFSLDVPLAQLEKGVAQMRASLKEAGQKSLESLIGVKGPAGSVPGLRPAASPQLAQAAPAALPPARPAAPVKRTIRIVGLDSGDKEINYTSPGSSQR